MPDDIIVCVDAGRTNVRVGVFDRRRTLLSRRAEPLRTGPHAADPLAHIVALIRAATTGQPAVSAAAVGVPALVERDSGATYDCTIAELAHRPLREHLRDLLGYDVLVANDATLAAVGEHRYGGHRAPANMLCLTIGSGVGGGLVIDGAEVWGSRGFAGEIGDWLITDRDGPAGSLVRLEAVSSGLALAAAGRRLFEQQGWDAWKAASHELDGRAVSLAAQAGDPVALRLFERAGWHLGVTISNIALLCDVSTCVIGGGLAKAGHLLLDPIVNSFQRHVVESVGRGVVIRLSTLLDDAALHGGAALLTAPERDA